MTTAKEIFEDKIANRLKTNPDVAEKLVRVTEESLEAGLQEVKAGARLGDVGHAIHQVAEGAGFSLVREYAGHGVGRALHEDPQVSNYGTPGRGHPIKPGLVIAIEPMVNVGTWRTRVKPDHWTVVTADGSSRSRAARRAWCRCRRCR